MNLLSAFSMTMLAILTSVLTVARLPELDLEWLAQWRPQWLLLMLIFWLQRLPFHRGLIFQLFFASRRTHDDQVTFRRGIFYVWIFGLFVDVLLVEPLGLNALIFAGIGYFLLRFRERRQHQSMVQQTIMVFLIIFIAEVFRALVLANVADQPWRIKPLTSALMSALVWPILNSIFLRVVGAGPKI